MCHVALTAGALSGVPRTVVARCLVLIGVRENLKARAGNTVAMHVSFWPSHSVCQGCILEAMPCCACLSGHHPKYPKPCDLLYFGSTRDIQAPSGFGLLTVENGLLVGEGLLSC